MSISKEELLLIKKNFGNHYSEIILEYLEKNNLKTRFGNSYHKDTIYKIVNGKQENKIVEEAILELLFTKIQASEKAMKKRKKILENLKQEEINEMEVIL